MLRSEKDLKGYRIRASDGEIGKVQDFLVGDRSWQVIYMVADTGVWIPKRKVLVPPMVLGRPDRSTRTFPVQMTRARIEESPEIEADMPVSLQRKREADRVGWMSAVAAPAGFTGEVAAPWATMKPVPDRHEEIESVREDEEQLRSLNELRGYAIEARDGGVGRVRDFILDTTDWTVRYVVVGTGRWLPGRTVILSPGWIERVDWAGQRAVFDLEKSEIESAPEYDPNHPVNEAYEVRLYDYYGRPRDRA